jgi:peptide/nickel transport system permease protein
MSIAPARLIGQFRNRVRRQPLAVAGVVLLAVFVLCGPAAPWLAPYNPATIDLWHRLQGPSAAHWAGSDELGRDTFSRLLWDARISLAVSVTVVAVSPAHRRAVRSRETEG